MSSLGKRHDSQAVRKVELRRSALALPLNGADFGKGPLCGYATKHRLIVIYSNIAHQWVQNGCLGSMSIYVLLS